jgi:hypothetical protein
MGPLQLIPELSPDGHRERCVLRRTSRHGHDLAVQELVARRAFLLEAKVVAECIAMQGKDADHGATA